MIKRFENGDETKIKYYHAHVYYGDDDTVRETAARLREKVWNKWRDKVRMGRFRDTAVGPHPQAMFQIEFDPGIFDEIVPWLMFNRDGLTILLHPDAEDPWRDHAWYPFWMGDILELRLDWLAAGNRKA
ncbi:MAG: hypothetical protein CFH41_00374 [Alphaproteobacteria bacterium MarineAlpha11_Bin1]|nr:MAG: hypothetical protein CFH41_00374 [Alphaproteobacteria bacterium MarineAlpha11_Bin1]